MLYRYTGKRVQSQQIEIERNEYVNIQLWFKRHPTWMAWWDSPRSHGSWRPHWPSGWGRWGSARSRRWWSPHTSGRRPPAAQRVAKLLHWTIFLPYRARQDFPGLIFGFRLNNSRKKTQNSRKKLKTQGKKINISAFFKYISKAYVSKAWLSKCECRTIEGTKKLENSRKNSNLKRKT